MRKRTIQKDISFSGIGIHSGKPVKILLRPSQAGHIVFCRRDLDDLELRVDPSRVQTKNCTILGEDNRSVRTIEHLMATLLAMGIDSLRIELSGEEIPVMDGSARVFAEKVLLAGTRIISEPRKFLKIQKPIHVSEAEALVSIEPASEFIVHYTIVFDHPAIGSQEMTFYVNPEDFASEIAPARTFGFLKDVPELWEQHLALGGSLENAIVLDEKGVLNDSLRYPDEFVRHKILDFLGDLALMGYPLRGRFSGHRAGHRLHLQAVRSLLAHPERWTLVE